MMASINTKRAIVEIVAIKSVGNNADRVLYYELEKYQEAARLARKENNKAHFDIYRQEIQKARRRLRILKSKKYILDIFVKKYNSKHRIEMGFDPPGNRKAFLKFINECIGAAIRQARAPLKHHPTPMPFNKKYLFMRSGTKQTGFVFTDEGSVLKAHVQKNMQMLLNGKSPVAPRRYVGIELEFCAPIKEEQFAVKLFQNGIHKFAQLKPDGSLRPKDKENSFELALLLEETTYKQNLKKVTKLLHEIKAVAKDRRCGLHVHLDMRRRDKDLVYNNLVACQYALLSVVDPNRYNNEFCRVVNTRKFPTEFTGDRAERYKTINAAAYYKYRTLEVRMHEGSVSFNEISHWVDLLLKVANYPKFLKNDVTKLPLLKTRLKLKDKLYNYALERSCSWQIQNNPNARNMREDIAELGLGRARQQPQPPANPIENLLFRNPFLEPVPGAVQDNADVIFRREFIAPQENLDIPNDLEENENGN